MSSSIKPIKVWGKGGINPAKVTAILEELCFPYETVSVPLSDVKNPDYIAINPNGRLPAIYDSNTNLTLWESGAIVEYLIERYDTTHQLSFGPGTTESYLAKQWLFFQVSGQGPYYGQAGWFKLYHPEQIPSAIERYIKEVNRVTAVLEGHLAKQKERGDGSDDGPWLVGNKLSYADISFVSWQTVIGMVTTKDEYDVDKYPLVKAWLGKLTARNSMKTPDKME